MLCELHLKNIGGVREAQLSFASGLTVITGESGTGKSSVVRALELAAGRRGDTHFLRAGEQDGSVEAIFSGESAEGGRLTAARHLSRDSSDRKKRALFMGSPVPLADYSSRAGKLMRIQGQFAQTELLDPSRQINMLDSCLSAEARAVASELASTFEAAGVRARELRQMKARRAEIEKRFSNADEALALVRKVSPEPGLEAKLTEEMSLLSRRIAHRERAEACVDALCGGMSGNGIVDALRSSLDLLVEFIPEDDDPGQQEQDEAEIGRGSSASAKSTVNEIMRMIGELIETAESSLGSSSEDRAQLEQVESRLGALRKLKRISGRSSEDELLTYCADAAESLGWLESSWPELESRSAELLELKKKASALARDLRRLRRETASELEVRVNALLGELAMTGITFEIQFAELEKLRRNGADEVSFALRTGARSGRVDKIASGGELSRLLLALQLSLPEECFPPTLVFDEVEAGLGGRAAVLAGLKLKELSRRCQVILVTHEASIAALGDEHILTVRENGESSIRMIDGEERVREIARMLSGSPDMTEAQEHARAMLSTALRADTQVNEQL